MYDPSVGRWLSEDPIRQKADDPNLYRYGGNNPTNVTDPWGLRPTGLTSVISAVDQNLRKRIDISGEELRVAGQNITLQFRYAYAIPEKDKNKYAVFVFIRDQQINDTPFYSLYGQQFLGAGRKDESLLTGRLLARVGTHSTDAGIIAVNAEDYFNLPNKDEKYIIELALADPMQKNVVALTSTCWIAS